MEQLPPPHIPPQEILDAATAVLSESGQSTALATLILKLRKQFPDVAAPVLNAAAEIVIARGAATEKLGAWAHEGYFSRSILEQASRSAIAAYRAQKFQGCAHILEIGTGAGSDTAALAEVATHVTTLEHDPETAERAKKNIALQGIENVTVLIGSAEQIIPNLDTSRIDGLFADPARRTASGVRVKESTEYSPPLDFVLQLSWPALRITAIKVSPGLFFEGLPQGSSRSPAQEAPAWSREFIGYGAECLDQTLWRGGSTPDSSVYLADRGVGWSPPPLSSSHRSQPLVCAERILPYIVEPHAVVNRSLHATALFAEHGIHPLAPDLAYGVSAEKPPETPLLSSFSVLESAPYHLRKLKNTLKQLGWTRRTEFKKRSYDGNLDAVRAAMDLPEHRNGAPFGTVFLFSWHKQIWAVLAQRCN